MRLIKDARVVGGCRLKMRSDEVAEANVHKLKPTSVGTVRQQIGRQAVQLPIPADARRESSGRRLEASGSLTG